MSTDNEPINTVGGSKPDVYNIHEIYDPVIHGPYDQSNDNTTIPVKGSLVVDNRSVAGSVFIWVVESVDPNTRKSTLVQADQMETEIAFSDRLITYGNDTLVLYFDDRANTTRLIVDSKFVLLGSNSSKYRITAIRSSAISSTWMESQDVAHSPSTELTSDALVRFGQGSSTDNYEGSVRISTTYQDSLGMTEHTKVYVYNGSVMTGAVESFIFGNFRWTNTETYTLGDDNEITNTNVVLSTEYIAPGSDGDPIPISVFLAPDGTPLSDRIPILDSNVAGYKVLGDSHTLYDMDEGDFAFLEIFDSSGVMTTRVRMITKRATVLSDFMHNNNPIVAFDANVNQTDGVNWLLYKGQNPEDLTIFPRIHFADGTMELTPIDDMSCFLYGEDDILTDVVGAEYTLMVKYFLAPNVAATIAQGGGIRFLLQEHVVKVVDRTLVDISKLSPIIKWNVADSEYQLTFIGYTSERDAFLMIPTSGITITSGSFDGKLLNQVQNFTVTATVGTADVSVTHSQAFTVFLSDHTSAVPWTSAASENTEFIYGENTSLHNRPLIMYNTLNENYSIPTSEWSTATKFLDDFYDRAVPPFVAPGETEAPTPTHFTLRDSTNGRTLLIEPIAVATYDQPFNILTTNGLPDQYDGSTVIVEFLKLEVDTYKILFGVPVTIKPVQL